MKEKKRGTFLFRLVILLSFAACLSSCVNRQAGGRVIRFTPSSDQVWMVELMAQRLELSSEVAWAKFVSGAPVHDPVRESQILEQMVAVGREMGLSKSEVETFFESQMAASRQVQEDWVSRWNAGRDRPSRQPTDLATSIRPRINIINGSMLVSLSKLGNNMRSPGYQAFAIRKLEERGFNRRVAQMATSQLR